jgi:predicted nucleic acid-binding protein
LPVSNASPLIYLAKIGGLSLLQQLFTQVQIPSEVKIEVVDRGKAERYSDAYVIEEALDEGWLREHRLTRGNLRKAKALVEMTGLDLGEAQVIILAKQKEEREVLIDQSSVRKVARHLELNPRGTIFVIMTAVKNNLITKGSAKEMLVELIDANFYLSAKTYHKALTAIEKL